MKSTSYSNFKKKKKKLISDFISEHIQIEDIDVNAMKFSVTFKKPVFSTQNTSRVTDFSSHRTEGL